MIRSMLIGLALIATSAHAGDVRVYQMDKHGNVQYHKPSLTIRDDGRVIQTDKHGNKLYHKQQYRVVQDRIVPVDATGRRLFRKPSLALEKLEP